MTAPAASVPPSEPSVSMKQAEIGAPVLEVKGGRGGRLLIRAARAERSPGSVRREGYGRFATAADEHAWARDRRAVPRAGCGQLGQVAADEACFPLQLGRDDVSVHTGGARFGGHRLAHAGAVRRAGPSVAPRRVRGVRGVGREVLADARREVVPEAAAVKDRDGVVDGRGVLDARVCDRVEHVAGHVGDRQADQARRRDAVGEAAALDRRDVLADRVDFDDRGAGAQEQLVELPLLGLRDPFGGRLVSAELPPVNDGDREVAAVQAVDEVHDSRGRRSPSARRGAGGRRQAPRSGRAPSCRRRRGPRRRRRRDGRRGSARASMRSQASLCPSRRRRPGRRGRGAYSRPAIAIPPAVSSTASTVARRTSHASSPAAATRSARARTLRHAGGGELSRVRDHAAIAAGKTSPG